MVSTILQCILQVVENNPDTEATLLQYLRRSCILFTNSDKITFLHLTNWCRFSERQKVSENDQEIPQTHTVDQPTAPWAESQNTNSHKTSGRPLKLNNQLSLPQQDD